MSLARTECGKKVVVVSLEIGRALEERLASLGIFPGAELEVVRSSRKGDMILSCLGSRFALGRELTNAIRVA